MTRGGARGQNLGQIFYQTFIRKHSSLDNWYHVCLTSTASDAWLHARAKNLGIFRLFWIRFDLWNLFSHCIIRLNIYSD